MANIQYMPCFAASNCVSIALLNHVILAVRRQVQKFFVDDLPQECGVRQIRRRENRTMAEKKKVNAAPKKKEAKKTLKGSKKLGETKLKILM